MSDGKVLYHLIFLENRKKKTSVKILLFFYLLKQIKVYFCKTKQLKIMHLTYNAINSQYAVKQARQLGGGQGGVVLKNWSHNLLKIGKKGQSY